MKKILIISGFLLSTTSVYCDQPLTGSAVVSERHSIAVGEALTGVTGDTSGLHISGGQVQGVIELADVSVSEIGKDVEVEVSVYPNPTSQILNVKHNADTPVSLSLTAASGANVMNTSLDENVTTLDLKDLPCSIYILSVTYGNELIYSSKVIKR